jgi:uncharacterized membrane protein YhhN
MRMGQAAPIDRHPWLLASLTAAVAFWALKDTVSPGPGLIALKGAGVALLAAYALARAASLDGRAIALVMALGALGDVLIELDLRLGAASFFAGHCVAIWLYRRNRRGDPAHSQVTLGLLLVGATPLIAWALPADRSAAWPVAVYALALGAMAGAAWLSRFNRYRVGLGALLFVASDLLIFARQGPLATSALPGLLIWPLYYLGQLLICTGVIGELRVRR